MHLDVHMCWYNSHSGPCAVELSVHGISLNSCYAKYKEKEKGMIAPDGAHCCFFNKFIDWGKLCSLLKRKEYPVLLGAKIYYWF